MPSVVEKALFPPVSQIQQLYLNLFEDTHTHSCYVVLLSLEPEFLGALGYSALRQWKRDQTRPKPVLVSETQSGCQAISTSFPPKASSHIEE